MKVEERQDGEKERRIVIAMVTRTSVLSSIAPKWQHNMFASKWANLVGKWCVDYYEKYAKAPRKAIQGLFQRWVDRHSGDKATIDLLERFLRAMSDEYEEGGSVNAQFLLDLAVEHFARVKLIRLRDSLSGLIDTGKITESNELIREYSEIDLGAGDFVDPFENAELQVAFFHRESNVLVAYPGALGEFFSDSLEREAFVSYMSPEKVGKSWWLMDMAFRAIRQRRRVAFFECGDMSKRQFYRRLSTRLARRPYRSSTGWPLVVKYPISIKPPDRTDKGYQPADVTFEDRTFAKALTYKQAREARDNLLLKIGGAESTKDVIKFAARPNSSLSVAMIRSMLKNTERASGWLPEVVVIDYADILMSPHGKLDYRHQIDATWRAMRALSEEYHCLVVTATQSDAASYNKYILDRSNFSDDKRKLAHITGMVGLNVTAEEKQLGVTRLNWIDRREGEFSDKHCVHVAGCLSVGDPAVKSA